MKQLPETMALLLEMVRPRFWEHFGSLERFEPPASKPRRTFRGSRDQHQLTSLKSGTMMSKFLLALGLCLCMGQLGEGAVGLRDLDQYLARYWYLEGVHANEVMGDAKAAVQEDYQSHRFHVLMLYRHILTDIEEANRQRIWSVTSAFLQLNNCVESQQLSQECLAIARQDSCNIKRRFILTKEQFNAKVAQALQTPGFDAVPGLVQDVQTLQAMVTEMDLDSEITDAQTFEAFVKNAHELALFSDLVDFVGEMVSGRMQQ